MLAADNAETEVCWIYLECIDRCCRPVTTGFLVGNDKAKPSPQVPHVTPCHRALPTHEMSQQNISHSSLVMAMWATNDVAAMIRYANIGFLTQIWIIMSVPEDPRCV